MRSNVSAMVKTGFGKSICYDTLPFVFNYKHSDGGTGGGCSVVLVMSPLVSLIMKPLPRKRTASCISSFVISPHNNLV